MKTRKYFLIAVLVVLFSLVCKSQKNNATGEAVAFDTYEFTRVLLKQLNIARSNNGLDSFDLMPQLSYASGFSVSDMVKKERADAINVSKNTPKYLKKAGCTDKGEELVAGANLGKGKNSSKPEDLAKSVVAKWMQGKKEKAKILQAGSVYVGVDAKPDEQNKKLYVSVIFGNFQSFNAGAKMKKELSVPFNKRSKKLKNKDDKKCSNCEKFKDIEQVYKGLSVENGKIYLSYDNLKNLKRLIKKSTDGFAVDVVMKEQYSKSDYNIMDNRLKNKGVMQKIVYRDKIFSSNLIKPDPKAKKKQKVNKLRIEIGKLPTGIRGSYELNLMVIQDNYVCKTVMRSYMEMGDQDSYSHFEMLPMPETEEARNPPFQPRSESTILNFTIPFEKNKSEYKMEDVKPFIDALQEPDFIIEGVFIYAYSSIEGDSVANSRLQAKRGESVVKVLQSMQKNKISPTIITNDSWQLFQLEMEDGKYDFLTKMTKKDAIKNINSKPSLREELEPYLAKQRFAQVILDVTYDISGEKEQKFCQVQFNKAVKQGSTKQALKIMDFIHHKATIGKYTESVWDELVIAEEAKNSGFLMNKVYYDYLNSGKLVDEDHYRQVKKINSLDPSNATVLHNLLFCRVKLDSNVTDKTVQTEIQSGIDALYKTKLNKKYIDVLNIEWQFRLLDALDTIEGSEEQRSVIIEKIKSFYNFKEGSWQNALKLANAFSRAKDYLFACSVLEPFLNSADIDPKLVFSYIAIASHVPEKFFSRKFSDALALAQKLDKLKYCKLFGEPYMTFQVLDNPKIKQTFRETGCE